MNRLLRVAALLPVFALANCGGSGEGLDENGRPGTDDGGELTADFLSIQDHVFTPICTTCHTGAAAPLGFRLDEDSSYAMLVNAPSVEVPGTLRVAPGNPDSSYLIQKLEGHASVGARMPLNQPPLPQATIDVIREWISNGASPPPMQATLAPTERFTELRVVVPTDGETFTRSAGDPLVIESGEPGPGAIAPENLVVERSETGPFDDGSETRVPGAKIDIRSRAPTVFAVVLPAAERIPGNYRVTLRGTPSAASDLVIHYTIEDLP